MLFVIFFFPPSFWLIIELQTREKQQRDHIESLCTEHERSMLELEAKREQLRLCEKGASNESEKMKLDHQKEMVQYKYMLYI